MRYTLLMHYDERGPETLDPSVIEDGRRALASYAAVLHDARVLLSAEILMPTTMSTTLRPFDGALRVQDGPFADTVEQLGGTVVIDVDDLDAAIAWAREAPPAWWGGVEIRPGATYVVDGTWTPNA